MTVVFDASSRIEIPALITKSEGAKAIFARHVTVHPSVKCLPRAEGTSPTDRSFHRVGNRSGTESLPIHVDSAIYTFCVCVQLLHHHDLHHRRAAR